MITYFISDNGYYYKKDNKNNNILRISKKVFMKKTGGSDTAIPRTVNLTNNLIKRIKDLVILTNDPNITAEVEAKLIKIENIATARLNESKDRETVLLKESKDKYERNKKIRDKASANWNKKQNDLHDKLEANKVRWAAENAVKDLESAERSAKHKEEAAAAEAAQAKREAVQESIAKNKANQSKRDAKYKANQPKRDALVEQMAKNKANFERAQANHNKLYGNQTKAGT
jgi:hypothetical protein